MWAPTLLGLSHITLTKNVAYMHRERVCELVHKCIDRMIDGSVATETCVVCFLSRHGDMVSRVAI